MKSKESRYESIVLFVSYDKNKEILTENKEAVLKLFVGKQCFISYLDSGIRALRNC